jgi:DNA-binding XRE family transcriptional regulator
MSNLSTLLSMTKPAEPIKKNNLATLIAATKEDNDKNLPKGETDFIEKILTEKLSEINGNTPDPSQTNSIPTGPDNWEIIQNELKALRKKSGLSQRALASKVRCSQGTITRAENHSWISLGTLIRIAEALGCKVHIN